MGRNHILAWLVLLVAALTGPTGAGAHATLVMSHPASGAVLEGRPERIQLQFNEAVSLTTVRFIDASGRARSDFHAEARGEFLQILPPQDLPRGTQTLSYRIVSADGHPVGGVLTFSIGAVGTAHEASGEVAGRAQLLWGLRVMLYLCLLGGVGAAVFRAWVAPGWNRRRLMGGLALGFVVLIASVGVQGLDVLDESWGALFRATSWEAALLTSYGLMAGLSGIAILIAAASLNELRPGRLQIQTALALVVLGAALAATGHAATAPPQGLMRPAVFLHVVAGTFWAGSLVPLFSLMTGPSERAMPALRRFSSLAIGGVAVLVVTGIALAVVQVETPAALWQTAYGRILLAKLGVVALLFLLAAMNRVVLTPALARGAEGAGRRLRWSIGGEVALMLMLAGLVAGWRFTPPPRNLAAELPPMMHLHGERLMVMITLEPGHIGSNRARLDVLDDSFAPFDPRELVLTLSPLDRSLESREIVARRVSEGTWSIDQLYIPLPGTWSFRIGALVSDFDRVELASEYTFNR